MTIETTTGAISSMQRPEVGARSQEPSLDRPGGLFADHPFFAGIDGLEIECLLGAAQTLRFDTGEILIRRGDAGESVLLVQSGRVAVESNRASGELVVVNVLEPGEMIGEMAVLEGATRSATVTALEPCEVLVIPHSEFLALIVNHPGMVIRMLGTLSERLRSLTEIVRGLS